MPHTYDFNITATLNDKVAPNALHAQIFELTVGTVEAPGALDKALDGVLLDGNTIKVTFSDELTDRAPLDAAVAAHDGEPLPTAPLPSYTESGKQKVQVEPREGTPYQGFSLNFCDPCTWHVEAGKVEAATMEADASDPSGKTFKFMDGGTHRKWIIDLDNGRVTQEHEYIDKHPVITVDGTPAVEQAFGYLPNAADLSVTGSAMEEGDYVLDPENGLVVFHEVPSHTPVATYHYATECAWYITPLPGKALTLLAVEIQFTEDVVPRSDIMFQPQILAAVAASVGLLDPALLVSNGGPIPDESYIDDPSSLRRYRRFHDFAAESQRTYPAFGAIGGDTSPRALKHALRTLRWPYDEEAARIVSAAVGTRIKVAVEHDIPFEGDYASVSVYALSTDGGA